MLILPIKKKWFDMILAGEKKEFANIVECILDKRVNENKSRCSMAESYGSGINPVHEWYLAEARRKRKKRILGAVICVFLIPVFIWSWNRIPSDKRIGRSIVSKTEKITESEMPAASIDSNVVKSVNPESKMQIMRRRDARKYIFLIC